MAKPDAAPGTDPNVITGPCCKQLQQPRSARPIIICNLPVVTRWRGTTPTRDPHTCRDPYATKEGVQ